MIEKLIGNLPANFLALIAINIVLIGGLFYLEERLGAARERVLMSLIESCQKSKQ